VDTVTTSLVFTHIPQVTSGAVLWVSPIKELYTVNYFNASLVTTVAAQCLP